MKKIPKKLNGFKGHIKIEQEMSNIVWSSRSIYMFETKWKEFITKHDLSGNKWLTVLSDERVDKVDPRYVLERWSKNVRRNHTNISSSYDEPVLDERTQRYNGALSRYFEACQVGSKSEGRTAIVHRGLDKIFSELQEYHE
ncbi:hypothetical protein PIB30_091007 [Stylosanthes scabra]|uniref:Protein FAR1-RELATED SEQUENCE n=1 Tax=Stylosanthes scabra TaxID=79078 RepID=A0ABU6QTV5_9FABA|nr:hypothetical protein [Stylosanthes scabra]